MVKKKTTENKGTKKVKISLVGYRLTAEKKNEVLELYNQSRFGEMVGDKIQYSMVEGLYLLDKKKAKIVDTDGKTVKFDDLVKKTIKKERNFWIKYIVFKDMRNRGYIVKTALKFGADFRVYDRGVKPGEDHAKWILYPVHEGDSFTWYKFSAMNRVAHSTRKNLLLGIVDDEDSVTYYIIAWTRP